MLSLKVEIPPAVEPMDLDFVKNNLKVSVNDDDDLIKLYMRAARRQVERATNRALINTKFRQSLDRFKRSHAIFDIGLAAAEMDERWHDPNTMWTGYQQIKLLRSPLVNGGVTITYTDMSLAQQTLVGTPPSWRPENEYVMADQIMDPAGNLQEVTELDDTLLNADGTAESGTDEPEWGTAPDDTADDGPLLWTCRGPAPAGDFQVDAEAEPPRIMPLYGQRWPDFAHVANAVQIHFWAGYGADGDAVPEEAKVCILQLVANWYENREAVAAVELRRIPLHFDDLLAGMRVIDFAPGGGHHHVW